jgi:RNA polymerase sigma-70 factor, ECF subfamily
VGRTAAPAAGETLAKPAADARAQQALADLDALRERARKDKDRRLKDRAADQVLVEKAKQGDAAAFRALVEGHQGRLFAVAFGMLKDKDDAMDVVQDAFIKAHKKLAEFEGAAAFSTWLYRICVNLCIDKKRADARRKKTDLDDALATEVSNDSLYADAVMGLRLAGANPHKNSHDKELGAEIGRALATLSEDHRSVLLLREVDGMSYEEISEALAIPKGTVMSRLFHARKNLQRELRPFLGLADGEGLGGGPDRAGREGDPDDE